MLMAALLFDPKDAVPMIIHLWYSAALPRAMIDALRANVQVMVDDVCNKIKDKPAGSMQAKTFCFDGRTLRLVLNKEEWFKLADCFILFETFTLSKCHTIRRGITRSPERIDFRERVMLQWPPGAREVDACFRRDGVLLPYGCSLSAFDHPNP